MKVKTCLLHDIGSMGNISRYEKGFYFEMNIQMMLDSHNISYIGNPIFFEEWKKHTNTGHDIIINESHLKVECKYLSKPIYESWFKRDWIARDADIYVTSNPYFVPYHCRKQLADMGKKLFTPYEFVMYILKLLNGNKYNLNEHVLCLITTYLLLKSSAITEIKHTITRLKDLFTMLKESVKVKLPGSQDTGMLCDSITLPTSKWQPMTLNFFNVDRMMKMRVILFPLFILKIDYQPSRVLSHDNAITQHH